ncbi:MAG: hypothetical protein ABI882_18025, partial [Acidobacteriota bacterium]
MMSRLFARYTAAVRLSSAMSATLIVAVLLIAPLFATVSTGRSEDTIPPDISQALDTISVDSLRGHLSFISSDVLEGRATPSPGLDIAAEYIAAQFRRVGLEPVGDDGYFQTAKWKLVESPIEGFALKLSNAGGSMSFSTRQVSSVGDKPLSRSGSQISKLDADQLSANSAAATGKIVIVESAGAAVETARRFSQLASTAELVIVVDRSTSVGRGLPGPRLIDPERLLATPASAPPVLIVHDPRMGAFYDALPSGDT